MGSRGLIAFRQCDGRGLFERRINEISSAISEAKLFFNFSNEHGFNTITQKFFNGARCENLAVIKIEKVFIVFGKMNINTK